MSISKKILFSGGKFSDPSALIDTYSRIYNLKTFLQKINIVDYLISCSFSLDPDITLELKGVRHSWFYGQESYEKILNNFHLIVFLFSTGEGFYEIGESSWKQFFQAYNNLNLSTDIIILFNDYWAGKYMPGYLKKEYFTSLIPKNTLTLETRIGYPIDHTSKEDAKQVLKHIINILLENQQFPE